MRSKRDFIIGIVVGVILASATFVCANQTIQAILNDQVRVVLDGKVQKFKDESTGASLYPITYNNRTYLPLRNVANLAGLTVDYDADTNTAILKTKEYANNNASSSNDSLTSRARLAVFLNNISQYYDRVIMDTLNIKQTLGIKGENVTDAQLYYMTANGLRTSLADVEVYNRSMPVGYLLPKTIANIYRVNSDGDKNSVVAYLIDDYNITGYGSNGGNSSNGCAGYNFYSYNEYHFVTSDGRMFTLPGYPLQLEDGTIQYYLSNEKGAYYIAKGTSNLAVGEININGDVVKEEGPIMPNNTMKGNLYGLTKNDVPVTKYGDSTTDAAANQPVLDNLVGTVEGRYTTLENN